MMNERILLCLNSVYRLNTPGEMSLVCVVKHKDESVFSNIESDSVVVSNADFFKFKSVNLGQFVTISPIETGSSWSTFSLRVQIDFNVKNDDIAWSVYTKQQEKEKPVIHISRHFGVPANQMVKVDNLDPKFITVWDKVTLYPSKKVSHEESLEYPSELAVRNYLDMRPIQSQDTIYLYTNKCKKKKFDVVAQTVSYNTGRISVRRNTFQLSTLGWGMIGPHTQLILRNDTKPPPPQTNMFGNMPLLSDMWIPLSTNKTIFDKLQLVLVCHILFNKKQKKFEKNDAIINSFPNKFILHGQSGTGKSMLVKTLSRQLNVDIIEVNSSDVIHEFHNRSNPVKYFFDLAKSSKPAILLFEDIDVLFSNDEDEDESAGAPKQFHDEFKEQIESIKFNDSIVVICTVRDINDINTHIRNMFDDEIKFSLPSALDRHKFLKTKMNSIPTFKLSDKIQKTEFDNYLLDLSRVCFGYTPASLVLLINQIIYRSMDINTQKLNPIESLDVFEEVRSSIVPYELSDYDLVTSSSSSKDNTKLLRFSDLVGMENVKAQLKESTMWIYTHSKALERMGITPSKGILLFGDSGVGKTSIVKAVANESCVNFLNVNAGEILSSFVGESERYIRNLFKKASENSPCVIFIDDIDAIFTSRESSSHFESKLVAQLLTEMDGISGSDSSGSHVIVIATTQKPQKLDSALLRPGRLDKLIYIPPPTPEDRKQLIMNIMNRMKDAIDPSLLKDEFIQYFVTKTTNASYSDVKNVFKKACLDTIRENKPSVTSVEFEVALNTYTPSLLPTTTQQLELFNETMNQIKQRNTHTPSQSTGFNFSSPSPLTTPNTTSNFQFVTPTPTQPPVTPSFNFSAPPEGFKFFL
eukprot:TRINITY_DN1758_c1_g1_i2.p1 TRINITY_DN1758_c1_g1~~TRINITY_DN1758_c1_g1_i2.p1  ORF type:complete len:865 (+),score=161.79 TRINITY_DN1758_c1_g1_i2:1435-4029(+)